MRKLKQEISEPFFLTRIVDIDKLMSVSFLEPVSPFKQSALAGRVALVTGGSSGMYSSICHPPLLRLHISGSGFEIVRQLGLHGAKVWIMGRRPEPIAASVSALKDEGIDAHGSPGDVRKFGDCTRVVNACVSHHGHLDVLVNCAAGKYARCWIDSPLLY